MTKSACVVWGVWGKAMQCSAVQCIHVGTAPSVGAYQPTHVYTYVMCTHQKPPEYLGVTGVSKALGEHGQRAAGQEAGDQACGGHGYSRFRGRVLQMVYVDWIEECTSGSALSKIDGRSTGSRE